MAFKKGWKTVGGIRQKGYHRESTEQPAELCRLFFLWNQAFITAFSAYFAP